MTIGSLMKVESIESIQGEHSAILSTFIKLSFVFKIFILSIFEWRFTQVSVYVFSIRKIVRDLII